MSVARRTVVHLPFFFGSPTTVATVLKSICFRNNESEDMPNTITPAAMTINEFSSWARVCRTKIYEELGRGALGAIKVGRRTLITADAANAWLAAQPRYAQSGAVA